MGASDLPSRYHYEVPMLSAGSAELTIASRSGRKRPEPGNHSQSRLLDIQFDYSKVAETKIPGLNWAVPSSGSRIVTGNVEFPLPGKLIGAILEIVD